MQAREGAAISEISDDQRLIELARQGSAIAFREIIRRNNRRLYRAIRCVLRDEAETEEALQEAYIRAFGSLEAFAGEVSLPTWLTRIALNQAFTRQRHRGRPAALPTLDPV